MSYEIVKNIRIIPNPENKSEYIMICTSASNNVRPHYYEEWTHGIGKGYTKEQMEREILVEFFNGNLQRGQSVYSKFVKRVCSWHNIPNIREFDEYRKLDRVLDKVRRAAWGRYSNKKDTPRYKQIQDLWDRLAERKKKVLEDTLYNLFHSDKYKDFRSTKVKPFTIIDKATGDYVRQLNKRTYYRCSQPVVHTSASVYNRAKNLPTLFFVEEYVAPGKLS